jgi:exonuclease SbcC
MFESFTKPGWQHPKPDVRITAINELDDESILLDLVHNDPAPEVRAHALSRLTGSETLDKLCETLSPPLQSQARAQRLNQLLPDPGQLASVSDDAMLVHIASLCDDPELVAASIGQVASLQVRMELAGSHPLAKVRLCAAQGIEDFGLLKELMQISKNKDKSVFRYCKEQVDQQHAIERQAAERAQQLQRLLEDVATLATAAESPEFRARYIQLKDRWQPLEIHSDPEQKQQIETDLEICAKRLAELAQAREAEQHKMEQVQAARKSFGTLLAELEAIESSAVDVAESATVRKFGKTLNGIEERWVAAMLVAHPSAEQTRVCKELLNQWREVAQSSKRVLDHQRALEKLHGEAGSVDKSDFMALQKLLNKVDRQLSKLTWPDSHSAMTPAPITGLRELNERLQEQLVKLKSQETETVKQVETAFEELLKELGENHFKNADRVHNRLRNLLRHLSPDRQDHFYHELRPLTARLGEIHDWQGFAIEPKKIELCERMAALAGSEEDPDILATRIKTLQKEWKALGPLSPRRDQALWKKFHTAAEAAYAPCKLAFEQQAGVHKENVKQRMDLVAQLRDYDRRMAWPGSTGTEADAPPPDWRLVQKTLDTARAAFNAIGPVSAQGERKSRKALQKICDKIYGHIKDEYERNITRKQELVNQAKSLVELEDLKEAIDGAKGLQSDWKNTGLTPRQLDRKLWNDFRAACDAVFARLDQERKQQNAAKNQQQEQYKAAKAEQAEAAKLRALKEQQRWPNLLEKMRACAMKTSDEKQATELWEKESDLPRGIDTEALAAWWEQGPDDKCLEDNLHQACIGIEILAGVDSPPEDKKARMAYQMQRLVEGMGSAAALGSQEDRLLEQVNNFIAMRPTGEWVERFCSGGKINPRHA